MLNCNYYNEIKNELINNEIYKRVKDYSKNRNELSVYYNVGKLLSEAGKHYGEGIIENYSKNLVIDVGKKYNKRTLFRIKQFYNLIEKQNLSKRQLRKKIKSKEYQRLDDNTKLKLINKEETVVSDFIKNPIIIRNKYNVDKEHITEKILQKLILEDIENFLLELGTGFSFIKSEYKIKIGSTYNYIDLLLFNYTYNCFVVIELKVTELKKEHIGQIEVYMNYVDKNIKTINQDKTIGVIICKKDNGYYIEYSSDSRIYLKEYILN